MGAVEEMQREFPGAKFLLVYVREAHACDEWETRDNVKAGIRVWQPTTTRERRAAALAMAEDLGLTFPIVVDGVDDAVSSAYGGWPERIYVLDEEGRIAYQGGTGPFDFRPAEAREFLLSRGLGLPVRP